VSIPDWRSETLTGKAFLVKDALIEGRMPRTTTLIRLTIEENRRSRVYCRSATLPAKLVTPWKAIA
jgi:hypothetical protein